MMMCSRAFGSLLGGPLAGYLLDAFGGPRAGTHAYRPALLLMGSICLVSATSLGVLVSSASSFNAICLDIMLSLWVWDQSGNRKVDCCRCVFGDFLRPVEFGGAFWGSTFVP